MTSTPIELGTLLDGWAASARVSVVETAPAVTVSRLDAASTQELLAATHRLGWDCDVQDQAGEPALTERSEEHTSELQSLMRISYAVFCLKKKKKTEYQANNVKTETQIIIKTRILTRK